MSEPDMTAPGAPASKTRLTAITLDQKSIQRGNPHIDHERELAIFDILDGNAFALDGRDDGPYTLALSIEDDKLMLNVGNEASPEILIHGLSMAPFKRIIRDYFLICDSYYEAIRSAPPARIQAIDQSRRGLHDDGSRVLMERLAGKITLDFDTARRLFTLISALHWRG